MRVDSLVELIDACDGEVAWLSQAIAARLRHHPGYVAVQQIPGVGPTLAAVFVVEIGDVSRFAQAPQLCSWAGLTPQASRVRHHRGPRADHQARVTAGAWAAVEAVQRLPHDGKLRGDRDRIAARRGRSIAVVAAARRLLTLVFYGSATATSAASTPPRREPARTWLGPQPQTRARSLS